MSSRAPRLFHYEEELRSAERALDTKLYRACILHCVLAVEAFVWDLLWGNDHVGVVFPPGTNPVPYQTVDLIFQYVRPCVDEHGKPAPVYPPDYQVGHPELKPYMEAFRKANKKLFRNGSDGLLLAQAVRTGVVSADEAESVRRLRTIRDFCCHFNPYCRTLQNYKECLRNFSIEIDAFKELPQVASKVFEETRGLLDTWVGRRRAPT